MKAQVKKEVIRLHRLFGDKSPLVIKELIDNSFEYGKNADRYIFYTHVWTQYKVDYPNWSL